MNSRRWISKMITQEASLWPGLGLVLVLWFCLSGCTVQQVRVTAAAATLPATPSPYSPIPSLTPSRTQTLEPTTESVPQANVVLTQDQDQQLTTIQVGQIINLANDPEFEWTISYRSEILLALTPEEAMSQPGSEGWFFRVIAPGATEIVLESKAAPCPDNTPCMPNVMRFIFPIEAVP
jgi:hypothetical protein